MTEDSSWKFAEWPELLPVVQKWSAEAWAWDLDAVTAELSSLGWTPRKKARAMLLFTTDISTGTEAILRLDNHDATAVRSLAITATSVVTPHESNTRKAKIFLAESCAAVTDSLQTLFGTPTESDESMSAWTISQGHIVVALTNRSVRITFFSPTGMKQADAAAKVKAETAGVVKKKKAPAPWRVV